MQIQSAPIPLSGTALTINDTAPTADRYNLGIVEVLHLSTPPPQPYSISGTVSGAIVNGVTVTLSGASTASTATDPTGSYSFTGLSNGPYTITPSKPGFAFTPANQSATVNNANVPAINFTSAAVPTYTISGTVSGTITSGVIVNLPGTSHGTTPPPPYNHHRRFRQLQLHWPIQWQLYSHAEQGGLHVHTCKSACDNQ